MVQGPTHRDWNFVCLPFSSWALPHFNTKSPALKLLFLAYFLLNQYLIQLWWMENISLALIPSSSSLRKVSILVLTKTKGLPWDTWESYKVGRYRFGGKITSLPYTRRHNEVLKEGLGVTWSTHIAFIKALCQLFFSTIFFLDYVNEVYVSWFSYTISLWIIVICMF